MSSELRICLENPNNCYYPGQLVIGKVECTFTLEKKVQGVFVKFKGECSTSWNESETYYDDFFKEDRTREVAYSGGQTYFNQEFNLTGPGGDIVTLPPGKHVYPFSYELPDHLPTSYEDPNGGANIRYTVKARIGRSWKFDIESVTVFNVTSPLDLNTVPRIREPVEISVDKVLCSCWCNNNDALTFTYTLPTIGYIPGQTVNVGVYVQNLTNVSVERVKFKITKLIEYVVTSPSTRTRSSKELIAGSFDGGIGAHGEKSWTATLLIPADKSFPNVTGCELIKLSYRLKGVVIIPYPHRNLSAYVPLTIGHIPLAGVNFNASLQAPTEERLPYIDATAPPSENTSLVTLFGKNNYGATYLNSTAPYGEHDSTAPPKYEEAALMKAA